MVGEIGDSEPLALFPCSEGMCSAHHRNLLYRADGFQRQPRITEVLTDDYRQRAAPVLQRGDRPSQRLHIHAKAGRRKLGARCGNRPRHRLDREQGIDYQSQFQLHPGAQRTGARPHGIGTQQDVARMRQQGLAFGRQYWPITAAIEQLQFQLCLQICNRMADRRLHAQQPRRAGAKAAAVGNRDERPDLIQRHCIEHDLLRRSC